MRHSKFILWLLISAFSFPLSAFPQSVGQYELRKRTSTGFTAYGITLSNGQVIGQTAGVPAAITPLVSGDLAAYLTSATAATTYLPLSRLSLGGLGEDDADLVPIFGAQGQLLAAQIIAQNQTDIDQQAILDYNGLTLANHGNTGFSYIILGAELTATRTQTLPDKSGTFAMTSDLPTLNGLLPSQAGNSGKVLTTDGSNTSWTAVGGGLTIGTTAITGGSSSRLLVSGSTVGELTPGSGVFTWLATNTKANLASAVSDDDPAFLGSANAYTAAQTITVGTNSATPADGLTLQNSTAAVSGTQSASPRFILTAQGYKTGGTPGSNRLDWGIYNLPVQSSASDTSLIFSYRVASGSWVDQMRLNGSDQVHYRGLAFPQTFSLIPSFSSNGTKMDITPASFYFDVSSATKFVVNNSGSVVSVPSGWNIGWSSSSTIAGTNDTTLTRAAAGIVGVSGLRVGSTGSSIGVIKRTSATFTAGTVTVADTATTANSQIVVTVVTPGGTIGFLDVDLSAGVGYTINSTSGTDTSTLIITAIHHP